MSAAEAIELIHQAGGVAVMAHPGLNRTDEVIPGLVEAGLDGSNVFTPNIPRQLSEHYLELADQFHLLVTGGSDCHGLSKGKPLIGTVNCLINMSRLSKRAPPNGSSLDRFRGMSAARRNFPLSA